MTCRLSHDLSLLYPFPTIASVLHTTTMEATPKLTVSKPRERVSVEALSDGSAERSDLLKRLAWIAFY